jgi:hypothetical protein
MGGAYENMSDILNKLIFETIYKLKDDEFVIFDAELWADFKMCANGLPKQTQIIRSLSARCFEVRGVTSNRKLVGGAPETTEELHNMLSCLTICKLYPDADSILQSSDKKTYGTRTVMFNKKPITLRYNPLFTTVYDNPAFLSDELPTVPTVIALPELPTDITSEMIARYVNKVFMHNYDEIMKASSAIVYRDNDIIRLTLESRFKSIMRDLCEEQLVSVIGADPDDVAKAIANIIPPTNSLSQLDTVTGLINILDNGEFRKWCFVIVHHIITTLRRVEPKLEYSGGVSIEMPDINGENKMIFKIDINDIHDVFKIGITIHDELDRETYRSSLMNISICERNFMHEISAMEDVAEMSDLRNAINRLFESIKEQYTKTKTIINEFLDPSVTDMTGISSIVNGCFRYRTLTLRPYNDTHINACKLAGAGVIRIGNMCTIGKGCRYKIYFLNWHINRILYNAPQSFKIVGAVVPQLGGRNIKLEALTRLQLIMLARKHNIKGITSWIKADILALLKRKKIKA